LSPQIFHWCGCLWRWRFYRQNAGTRLVILAVAGATDLLDGVLARRFGSSRFGPVIDRCRQALRGGRVRCRAVLRQLAWYEIAGVLARDRRDRGLRGYGDPGPRGRHSARAGGKAVTLLQLLTLIAFC
jgi:hypothetical protein